MKQATQLQIQWPDEALAARPSCGAGFYEAFQHFSEGLRKSVTKPSCRISLGMCSLPDLLRASLAVCFCFALMFLSALIGG